MKRVFTIFLVLLYSVASIGATATTHLCAGKVKKCKCAKSFKKDICCSEKTVYLKSQDKHQSQSSTNNIVKNISKNNNEDSFILHNNGINYELKPLYKIRNQNYGVYATIRNEF